MRETKHDNQGNLSVTDCYNSATYNSWQHFKFSNRGFRSEEFNDSELFVFRYDIDRKYRSYTLKLYVMWQTERKYVTLYIKGISQEQLDTEVREWLKRRRNYLANMWREVVE